MSVGVKFKHECRAHWQGDKQFKYANIYVAKEQQRKYPPSCPSAGLFFMVPQLLVTFTWLNARWTGQETRASDFNFLELGIVYFLPQQFGQLFVCLRIANLRANVVSLERGGGGFGPAISSIKKDDNMDSSVANGL